MKNNKWIKWMFLAISVAINIFIIVNSCLSGEVSGEESGNFAKWFANFINLGWTGRINNQNFNAFAAILRKLVGHFGLFAFSALATLPTCFLFLKETKFNKNRWFLSLTLLVGLFLAFLTEFIQIFTPGRSGQFTDIAIDFGGYLFGAGLSFATLLFLNIVDIRKF